MIVGASAGYGHVTPLLAIGSAPPAGVPLKFDMLVLTAQEYQPDANSFPGVQLVYAPLDDDDIPARDIERARVAGRIASNAVRQGKRVLVTCYMGRNRSGLVTAFALKDLGFSSRDAIHKVKAARGPNALSNPYFVRALGRA